MLPPPLDIPELVGAFADVAAKLLGRVDAPELTEQRVKMIIRQAVQDAMRSRKQHHTQIIEIERLITRETRTKEIRARMPGWLERAGISKIETLNRDTQRWFTVLNGEDEGDCVRVVHPAYLDIATGAVVQSGQARIDDHETHGGRHHCVPLAELTGAAGGTDVDGE
ncbi:hypothetical protein [Actinomadura parmotrematis]|uniref:Phage portal protein n=1 Tax=Actinomadura parmotrematis TaxID=2864039 RepID=A0ABS7FU70_9ACTN|nr:hypothetical protein [Actinomadura parmotrematis]MBW8483948.1 hypothetical protein [Actinomadura parmotrematis]